MGVFELAVLIIGIALVFDFINGFHDAANSIATVVATRVLSPGQAVLWAAFFNFVAAFLFGTAVARTVGSGFVNLNLVTPYVIMAGLAGAILWDLTTWWLALPTSSSHALIGGYAGAAIARAGIVRGFTHSFEGLIAGQWSLTIVFIFAAPLIGMISAYALMIAVYWLFRRATPSKMDFYFRKLQLLSAASFSLSHGSNDAQKTMGIITGVLVASGFQKDFKVPVWVILAAGTAIGLGTLSGGIDHFTGKAGLKRWNAIAAVVARSWDDVLGAVDEIVSIPDVDTAASDAAAAELAEPFEKEDPETTDEPEAADDEQSEAAAEAVDEEVRKNRGAGDDVVLGGDEDFWLKVGIDPIRMVTGAGTFYTLRCYFDDRPIFLGRNGRISVFSSERALARYLADEHDHDLSDLSTYDDIRTAATGGSLRVDVTDDNVYVLTGLADDLANGPDAVDRDQLDLAVELLRDVGDYAEDNTADQALSLQRPLGKLAAYVLDSDSVSRPAPPYADAVRAWEELEGFVESRLRRE